MPKSPFLQNRPSITAARQGFPVVRYAFGSGLRGRTASFGVTYKYGFNNQEKEGELGEYYSFEYRVHDARLGRFLSVDPWASKYTFQSVFIFGFNNPIKNIDYKGLGEPPRIGQVQITDNGTFIFGGESRGWIDLYGPLAYELSNMIKQQRHVRTELKEDGDDVESQLEKDWDLLLDGAYQRIEDKKAKMRVKTLDNFKNLPKAEEYKPNDLFKIRYGAGSQWFTENAKSLANYFSDEPKWMTWAKSQIGVTESTNPENEAVNDYHRNTTLSANSHHNCTPWCSSFASTALQNAGYDFNSAWAFSMYSWNGAVEINEPVYGAIVVITWYAYDSKKKSWIVSGGHIGFAAGQSGNQILILGGNQGPEGRGSVNYSFFTRTNMRFFIPTDYVNKSKPLPITSSNGEQINPNTR